MSPKGKINGNPLAANVRQFVSVKVSQVFKNLSLFLKSCVHVCLHEFRCPWRLKEVSEIALELGVCLEPT